jgi:hypothetical protein
MPMMAMTTNNSIKVNAKFLEWLCRECMIVDRPVVTLTQQKASSSGDDTPMVRNKPAGPAGNCNQKNLPQ